jgi:hypothetical protein
MTLVPVIYDEYITITDIKLDWNGVCPRQELSLIAFFMILFTALFAVHYVQHRDQLILYVDINVTLKRYTATNSAQS